MSRLLRTLLLMASLLFACIALAGGGPALLKTTIDTGGGRSQGGSLVLTGTIGQPDAGTMSGGSLGLQGGFWFSQITNLIFSDGFESEEENP